MYAVIYVRSQRVPTAAALFRPLRTGAGRTEAFEPDVLIFTNGEKLVGHLEKAHGGTVTFKSDSLGEVNVDWKKVQELHSSETFVAIHKDVKLNRKSDTSKLPTGKVAVEDQKLTVTPTSGAPQTNPVADTAHLIDQPAFERVVLHSPGFFEAWNGAVTAGATLVEATQQSRTFTGGIALVRAIPTENWLAARDRTLIDFSATDGLISQPGTPSIKTDIVHGDIERDEYFSGSNVFAFGRAAFDHNFSQGLDLQQNYGGGIGWTAIKRANTTLDFKGSVSYTRESFSQSSNNENLIGSGFAEAYAYKFAKGIQFLQGITGDAGLERHQGLGRHRERFAERSGLQTAGIFHRRGGFVPEQSSRRIQEKLVSVNNRPDLYPEVRPIMEGMRALVLLLLVSEGALAQMVLDPARLSPRMRSMESSWNEKPLDCSVTPIKPSLNFAFRIEAGFTVRVPMNQFFGPGHGWVILTRITPQAGDRKPVYLGSRTSLPDVPKTKIEAEIGGGYLVGEGKYDVRWMLIDDQERSCHKDWTIDAHLTRAERDARVGMQPNSVDAFSLRGYHGAAPAHDDSPPFRVTILMHAAPLSPRRTRLRATDQMLLIGSLSALLERLPTRSVRMVAFNLDQQKEIYRRDNFTADSIQQVWHALNRLELNLVDYRTLLNRHGHIDLLADLVHRELHAEEPSDAVVILGPVARSIDKPERDAVEKPARRPSALFLFPVQASGSGRRQRYRTP